jgi:ABC-type microcin C transport system permease subunit YejE
LFDSGGGIDPQEEEAFLLRALEDAKEMIAASMAPTVVEQDNASVLPLLSESNDTAAAESPHGMCFQHIRDSLAAFFKERVSKKKWTLYQPMPKKGSDKQFDSLLANLQIEQNRRYASTQWRQF